MDDFKPQYNIVETGASSLGYKDIQKSFGL